MNDFGKNVTELERKLFKNPNDWMAMNDLAISLMEARDYEKALYYFKKTAEIHPSVQSLNNLGYFYYNEGEPEPNEGYWKCAPLKAKEALEKAVSLKPTSDFPYSQLAVYFYISERNLSKALELLSTSVQIDPSYENLNNLGVCYFLTQDISEAKEYFHQATLKQSKANESATAMLNYGICLARLGEKDRGREIAERLLVKDAYDIEVEDIADIYYENEDYEKVVSLLENKEMFYPVYWASIFLFSLNQMEKTQMFESAFQNVIKVYEEEIIETKNDENDWKLQDKESYIKELKEDILKLKQLYLKIQDGTRPELNFIPSTEFKCYLFGCRRHNNPNYIDL